MIFPFPAGMSLTKLIPARKSLVSDIPADEGKMANLFLQCMCRIADGTEKLINEWIFAVQRIRKKVMTTILKNFISIEITNVVFTIHVMRATPFTFCCIWVNVKRYHNIYQLRHPSTPNLAINVPNLTTLSPTVSLSKLPIYVHVQYYRQHVPTLYGISTFSCLEENSSMVKLPKPF
jgi:hypothetical protein